MHGEKRQRRGAAEYLAQKLLLTVKKRFFTLYKPDRAIQALIGKIFAHTWQQLSATRIFWSHRCKS